MKEEHGREIIDCSMLPNVEHRPDSKDDVISYYKILVRKLKEKLSHRNHIIFGQANHIRKLKHWRRRNKKEIKDIIKNQLIDLGKLRNPEEAFNLTKKQAIIDFNSELKYILELIDEMD